MKFPKLILAPMAGVNCTAFRMLCRAYGADLVYSQMYDIKDLIDIAETKDIREFLNIPSEDHPLSIQLIGAVNDDWEQAVKIIESYADYIDINFGCAESDKLEKRSGSYLLQHPEQIRKIIRTVKSVTKKPITAKIRSGWSEVNSLEIGTLLQEEGIHAIAIHPRTKKQRYTGKADWTLIKELKEHLSIPVIGNGDIQLPGHAKAMLEQTRCDAIMVGRATMKDPSLFVKIKYLLKEGKNYDKTISSKHMINQFMEYYETYQDITNLSEIKDHICWMLSGQNSYYKEKVRTSSSIEDVKNIVEKLD